MDTDKLISHAKYSSWKGVCEQSNHLLFVRNPRCGDQISMTMNIVDGVISQVRFQGQGCIVSQSCASMLCENIEGKEIKNIINSEPELLLGYGITELTLLRRSCALLAVNALINYLKTEIKGHESQYD